MHYHLKIVVPDGKHARTYRFHTDRFISARQVLGRYDTAISVDIHRVQRCNDPESINHVRLS